MKAALLLLLAVVRLAGQGAAVEGRIADAATGRPIGKAEVTLRGLTKSGDPPDTDNYTAETDANGHFLVQGMAPGKYEATASRAGYMKHVPGRPWEPGSITWITLSEGQHGSVALKLTPPGVISGRIVNMDGERVAAALVEVLQEAYGGPDTGTPDGRRRLQSRAHAPSDDRGEYRIFGLPPGRYTLRVAESSGTQGLFDNPLHEPVQTFRQTTYPGVLDVAAGGELRNVEIRLRLELPHAVRGFMPGPHTNEFSVTLQRRGEPSGPQPYSVSGLTDQAFFFEGVMPGSYVVSTTIHDPAHPEQALFARQEVEVVDRDVEGVTLALIPFKTVTGKVTADGPLAFRFENMNVELDPDNPDSPTVTKRVAADGTFSVEVLPEGYTLTRPRIATAYVKSVKIGNREVRDGRIDFGHIDGPLEIGFGTDGGKVSGVVKDAEGNPAPAARVTLIPAGAQKDRSGRARSANADEDGRFELPATAPGEYKLFAWLYADQAAPLDPEFRRKYEDRGVDVRIEPKGGLVVELRGIVTRP